MVISKHLSKRIVCVLLVLTLVVGMAMFSTMQFTAADAELAETSADSYYLWAQNTNGPNFSSMSTPTGQFTYDSSLGYYYYDVETFGAGDYCFVISTNSTSGSAAVGSQAVSKAASGGSYYLTTGNYSGYSCFHIWNEKKEAVRIYFTSASAGVNAVALSSVGNQPATQQPATQQPATQKPNPQQPTSQPATSGGGSSTGNLVYCKNSAGWSAVTVYMWQEPGNANNGGWPGKNATYIGDDVWQYEVPGDFNMIIFSNSGSSQTSNQSYPGNGYIFDNKTGQWSIYDTSPVQVRSFTTNLQSPQYKGMQIALSAVAVGNGTMSYRFSAKSGNTTSVIADYSTSNTAIWQPTAVGTYTLVFDFKDSAGNTNSRTMEYVINDDSALSSPVIKSVTPLEGQIKKGVAQTISVTAGGGKTGTNLIFYKYTVQDDAGNTVNVPYFTKNPTYTFTPSKLGTYKVTVTAQASDNSESVRTYTYESVNDPSQPTQLVASLSSTGAATVGNKVTISAGASGGSAPYTYRFSVDGSVVQNFSSISTYSLTLSQEKTYTVVVDVKDSTGTVVQKQLSLTASQSSEVETRTLKGDADRDGEVTIVDATVIQRYLAKIITEGELNRANADVDDDGTVAIIDATHIQRKLAKLENW